MSKPIIRKIGIIDANVINTIFVNWLGARSYALRIVITDAETNGVVYDVKETTFNLNIKIPAHTLTNDRRYFAQAQTFDMVDTPSTLSDKVGFYALSTPTFQFEDTTTNVTTSSYTATVDYYSPDLERISSYAFYLYDSTKKQLFRSNVTYGDTDISYTYKGLSNDTDYYVRCVAVTVNGLELDTGYKFISVNIENPSEYARLYATPIPERGGVQVSTNLVVVQYNGDEEFSYEDGRIILTDKKLVYDSGFKFPEDFTLILKGLGLWKNDTILTLKNQKTGDKITLSSHIYTDSMLRFNLKVFNGLCTYLIYSDPLVFTNDDEVTIGIRRIGNIYQIKTFVATGVLDDGNWWWGTQNPTAAIEMDRWVDTKGALEHYYKDQVTEFFNDIEPLEAIMGDLWYSKYDYSADVTVGEISTAELLEKYLVDYTITAEYLANLTLIQMTNYLKWFNSFVIAVKASLNSDLLETFYKWSKNQAALVDEWYVNHESPSSLNALIATINQNIDTILP